MLRPDSTIGILGGGQLGRMLALAAARLGFKCHVFCPEPASPAFDVVRRVTEADYGDIAALARFADDVDVITYEFENIPAAAAAFLSAQKPVLPDPRVLATTQDRLVEKEFIASLAIPTAPFAAAASAEEITSALKQVGQPAVLKTRRFGYDGKGQAMIRQGSEASATFQAIGAQPAILEAFVTFEREISVARLLQHANGNGAALHVVTHEARAGGLEDALSAIGQLADVHSSSVPLPVISDRGVAELGWT